MVTTIKVDLTNVSATGAGRRNVSYTRESSRVKREVPGMKDTIVSLNSKGISGLINTLVSEGKSYRRIADVLKKTYKRYGKEFEDLGLIIGEGIRKSRLSDEEKMELIREIQSDSRDTGTALSTGLGALVGSAFGPLGTLVGAGTGYATSQLVKNVTI